MKTIYTAFLALFIMTNVAWGQDHNANILSQVKEFNNALLNENYDEYVKMMNPAIVKLGGGEELMAKVEEEKMATFSSMGMKYKSFKAEGVGEIVNSGNELQAILTQSVEMGLKDDSFIKTSYFLATSVDGETWKFLDLEPYDYETVKDYIPNFSDELSYTAPKFLSTDKE